MKRLTIILMALVALGFANAQEKENAVFLPKKNEVKLNLASSVFWSFPEVSYERILDEDISVGVSLGALLDNDTDFEDVKFEFVPYFRWFFGGNSDSMRKYGAGFFIEANTGLFLQEEGDYSYVPEPKYKDELRFGLGAALGWKYISRNNWVGEIFLGGGKTFGHDTYGYPRVGITIGKRF